MSHDSRYETQCPAHGWYFFEDGCAVTGCENAPANESGAFPETLREAAQEVVAASETMAISGAHDRAIRFFNALFALRAALERPRPAPPEPPAHEMFNAELRYKGLEIDVGAKLCALAGFRYDEPYGVDVTFDDYDTSFEFKNTPTTWEPTEEHRAAWWAMGFARAWVCYSDGTETYYAADGTVGKRHAGHAGGTAGTGAAPTDVCNCWDKAPTIPTCRGPNTHLDDCPAKDSGLPVGVNWQREMARRLGTPSRKPCYSCATGHLDLLEIPVCDTCGDFLVSGRIAKVLDRVRGGAAQPPPSALEMRNDNLRSELEGVYRDYDFLRAEFDEYKRTHPGVPREETKP